MEEEETAQTDVGTKRPRESIEEDSNSQEKDSKRTVNGCEDDGVKEVVVILDAGAQYGKV